MFLACSLMNPTVTRMIRKLTSLLLGIIIVTSPASVNSWQVIAHYQLGVEAGIDPDRSYQMLPDSWPSHGGLWDLYDITEWFAWSHAVELTGKTDWVPNVPRTRIARNDPGQDMYNLYIKGNQSTKGTYETALGFLTHNAQDKAVHYDYFRGGSKAAWKEEHQDKEIWADCWIFQQKIGMFDSDGNPQGLPEIHNTGQPEIIAAAQQVFRKTGSSLASHEKLALPMESVADIRQRILETEQMSIKYLADFSERLCIEKERWALNYDWTLDKLQDAYEKALKATKQVKEKFPPSPRRNSSGTSTPKSQPKNDAPPAKDDPNRFD